MKGARGGLGAMGERLVADEVVRRGWSIIARNVRFPEGEIDIVARDGPTLVFVEVRTRRGSKFGAPQESITPAKRRHLVSSAERYLAEHPEVGEDWRIDLFGVALSLGGKVERLDHFAGAIEA